MYKFASRLALALLASVVLANTAAAWTITRNFNDGVLGEKAQGTPDGFSEAAGGSLYNNEKSFEGGKSAKLHVREGTAGFGYWGGIINLPQRVYKGETIWQELYIYVPSTFEIRTPTNGSLKFLRYKSEKADGSHSGYIDIQIIDDVTNRTEEFRMLREGQAIWYYFGQNGALSRDTWHRVNVEIGVDSVPVSQGGGAYIKVWLDGFLLTTERQIKAIMADTDYIDAFYLFTYWNGNAPKDQFLWVDNIQLTNQRPAWADELGSAPFNPPAAPSWN